MRAWPPRVLSRLRELASCLRQGCQRVDGAKKTAMITRPQRPRRDRQLSTIVRTVELTGLRPGCHRWNLGVTDSIWALHRVYRACHLCQPRYPKMASLCGVCRLCHLLPMKFVITGQSRALGATRCAGRRRRALCLFRQRLDTDRCMGSTIHRKAVIRWH